MERLVQLSPCPDRLAARFEPQSFAPVHLDNTGARGTSTSNGACLPVGGKGRAEGSLVDPVEARNEFLLRGESATRKESNDERERAGSTYRTDAMHRATHIRASSMVRALIPTVRCPPAGQRGRGSDSGWSNSLHG